MMMTHELGLPMVPVITITIHFPAHAGPSMCRNKSCFSRAACLVHSCKAYYDDSFGDPCPASALADGGRLTYLHGSDDLCMMLFD